MSDSALSRVVELVGRPHRYTRPDNARALDCAQACAEALRRLGLEDAAAALPVADSLAVRESIIGARPSPWRRIGRDSHDARIVGDIVLVESPNSNLGVWVLVDVARSLFLTSTLREGVHLAHRRSLHGVHSVWRYDPAS